MNWFPFGFKRRFKVELQCCGMTDGFVVRDTYDDAVEFRQAYVSYRMTHSRRALIYPTRRRYGRRPNDAVVGV